MITTTNTGTIQSNTNNNTEQQVYLTTLQVVEYFKQYNLNISSQWLRTNRTARGKTALPYHKIASRIYYKVSDLETFIESTRVE